MTLLATAFGAFLASVPAVDGVKAIFDLRTDDDYDSENNCGKTFCSVSSRHSCNFVCACRTCRLVGLNLTSCALHGCRAWQRFLRYSSNFSRCFPLPLIPRASSCVVVFLCLSIVDSEARKVRYLQIEGFDYNSSPWMQMTWRCALVVLQIAANSLWLFHDVGGAGSQRFSPRNPGIDR